VSVFTAALDGGGTIGVATGTITASTSTTIVMSPTAGPSPTEVTLPAVALAAGLLAEIAPRHVDLPGQVERVVCTQAP